MPVDKKHVLECLHELLSKNVLGDKQYASRYKGFRGELDFYAWFRKARGDKAHNGGYLLPKHRKDNSVDDPVYIVVNKHRPSNTDKKIFSSLQNIPCGNMYFIQYNSCIEFDKWKKHDVMSNGTCLPVPEMSVFLFDKVTREFKDTELEKIISNFRLTNKKDLYRCIPDKMANDFIDQLFMYDELDLLDLYVDRLIFDGFIGYKRDRGIPSDIDLIVQSKSDPEKFLLLEIKEKDKSKTPPCGFGMDEHRIKDINEISVNTGLSYYYVVRHVNNQTERRFLEWLIIDMKKFIEGIKNSPTIAGGTGMRGLNSYNPTKVCSYEKFTKLR